MKSTTPVSVSILNLFSVVLSVCLVGTMMACGNGTAGNQSGTKSDTTKTHSDTANYQEAVYNDDDADDIQFLPKEISSAAIGNIKILHSRTFKPDEALKALFPGTFYLFPSYGDSTITQRLISWKCTDCSQLSLPGWEDEAPAAFPYTEGNMTMYTDTLHFTDDNGRENILVALSTLPVQSREFMFTGRFSCAVLGLALFSATNNGWQLTSFAPALGCYGPFQSMPKIHALKFGTNNYGCYLFNTNGGAGGPFYSDVYVFGIVNGQFKKILEDSGVQRFNAGECEWKASIAPGESEESGFRNLALAITGTYNKTLFTSKDTISNLPKEILPSAATKDSLNFKIIRTYKFNGQSYQPAGSTIEAK